MTKAAEAANDAHLRLKKLGVQGRAKVIEIVKGLAVANAEPWGKFEFDETKIGRLDHKIGKLLITKNVPGTEWLQPYAMSGDGGITLEEYAPFGVIGAILPVTHSVPTLTGNVINMVAAGNAIVFNPHPGGARSAAMAVRAYNEAVGSLESRVLVSARRFRDLESVGTQEEIKTLEPVDAAPRQLQAPELTDEQNAADAAAG